MKKKLTDAEQIEFLNLYLTKDVISLKKFSAKKLIKYANFLRHYTLTLSDGTKKEKEHTEKEILQSLFVLFNIG